MNDHPVMGAAVFFLFALVSAMLAFTPDVVLLVPIVGLANVSMLSV